MKVADKIIDKYKPLADARDVLKHVIKMERSW